MARIPHILLPLGGLLLAALPVSAAAQADSQRVIIEAFRDSLRSTSDSTGLLALERGLIDSARQDRDNPMLHLRLGFVALRLGDLGSQSRYEDAAGEFEWAAQLQPSWPWAWYGLGLAEDGVGDSQISIVAGLQAMFGKDHLSRAANAYIRAVQVDPSFVRGLIELASTALRQRINVKLDVAREALRQAALTSATGHPDVLLYRGRVEREVGDIDSAIVAFRGYLDRGGHRGLGLVELGRTLLARGDLSGQQPYYEGAAIDDSVSIAVYREDLSYVADDSILTEFDRSTGRHRAAYLSRFWGERDQAEMRRRGERLAEHYRRIFYARRHFQLVTRNRHYEMTERFRSGSKDFDDRGVIYIRHGEPNNRASYNAPGVELNESWHYTRADGDLVFHFVAREDVQDYKLVESVFDVLRFSESLALRSGDDTSRAAGVANQLMLSRERFSPVYSKLIGSGRAGAQKYFTEERSIGRRSIERGTRSDSYELSFARPLRNRVDAVVVGQQGNDGLLHVSYAIPGSTLDPVPSERGYLYPIRVRVSVIDGAGRTVSFTDTSRVFVAREPVPQLEHLVGRVAVPVVPGKLHYRVAIQSGDDAGAVLPTDTITASNFNGSTFAVSGVVLGSRNANLAWRPLETDTVFFNPLQQYRPSTPMELYYEVYGLPQGTEYRTQLSVTKQGGGGFLGLFGGRKATISLSFTEPFQAPVTRVHRTLGLERLSPGDYWLEVQVTDPDGNKHRSRAAFTVHKE